MADRGLALVTGASSGIGEAYAERLAADGSDLILVARRGDRLEALGQRLATERGCGVEVAVADLGTRDGIDTVASIAAARPLDLLVNNAGLGHYKPFVDLPEEQASELVELNVLAPVLITHAALPGMIERGRGAVVNIASLLAWSGAWVSPTYPKRAVYAGSKSFLVTFTQVLARELEGTGVRAQVLCPGVVRTEFHSRQGVDMSARTRMEPADVAAAGLLDLERGVVVSVPGLEDEEELRAVEAAEAVLAGATGAVSPASRYAVS